MIACSPCAAVFYRCAGLQILQEEGDDFTVSIPANHTPADAFDEQFVNAHTAWSNIPGRKPADLYNVPRNQLLPVLFYVQTQTPELLIYQVVNDVRFGNFSQLRMAMVIISKSDACILDVFFR